ncbi:hypothetical protein MT378_03925 [Psychrobacter sp. 16-Bac2893]
MGPRVAEIAVPHSRSSQTPSRHIWPASDVAVLAAIGGWHPAAVHRCEPDALACRFVGFSGTLGVKVVS